MQNRGAIILLAVLLALVSVYQLSFTGRAYMVKRDAARYAQGDLVKELNYLDSIASLPKEQWSFLGNTFRQVQEKEINLGLDLRGGMNVMLEVGVEDIVMALSNYSDDPVFLAAMDEARRRQRENPGNFIDHFRAAFEQIDSDARLAAIFSTVELRDKVNFNSSNDDVVRVLKEESEVAVNNAFNILRTRIDRFGVAQPNISRVEGGSRIVIGLPGVKDPQRVRSLLQGTASLEFWETYENSELFGYLNQANDLLRDIEATALEREIEEEAETEEEAEELLAAIADTAEVEESLLDIIARGETEEVEPETMEEFALLNPLFGTLNPMLDRSGSPLPGSVIGISHSRDTARVNRYMAMDRVRSIFPRDVRFFWSQIPYAGTEHYYELHAIKVTTREGRAPLDGGAITSARPSQGTIGTDIRVTMSMNAEGARTWARMTRDNIDRNIAIVLDGYVRSAPRVQNEIRGGSSEITGGFTLNEAEDLSNILRSGRLPAPARIVYDTVVGPSLGQQAVESGLRSFIIAFLIVLLYMVFYYSRRAGLVADIALLVNMFFLIGVLASIGAVLTLPGIAGIVLTIGLSVDANVLIYERIREEIRAGKGIRLAIADGYRNAYSAIIDGNVTTLLTGVVLLLFGTGPIKGFATTLVIGILTSLFSAVFITRVIYDTMLRKNMKLTFAIKPTENFLRSPKFNFLGVRKLTYVISFVVISVGVLSLATRGLSLGIDFTGGRTYIVAFDEPVETEDIANALGEVFEQNPEVITYGTENQVKISTQYRIEESGVDSEVEITLYEGLRNFLEGVTLEQFLDDYRVGSETVGPTIARDIKIKALWAVSIALIVIFIYMFIRFRNWQFGLGAVASLVHDTLFVLGVFSLGYGFLPFSLDIDQAFIAAILTVIGYSVNDSVVVFDRIREYRTLYRKRPRMEVMNLALNSTLSRTVNTSFTTGMVLLIIFIFGGEVIRGFVFALLLGVLVGTYSSLFVGTPLVYDTLAKEEPPKEKEKGNRK